MSHFFIDLKLFVLSDNIAPLFYSMFNNVVSNVSLLLPVLLQVNDIIIGSGSSTLIADILPARVTLSLGSASFALLELISKEALDAEQL